MTHISPLKHRAITLLFLDGSDPWRIAKLFRLTKADVEDALRVRLGGRRRRRPRRAVRRR